MGMKRGAADAVCRYRPGRDGLKGRGRTEWRGSYQRDHGGSGSGTRYDVQVIGQVELKP